MRYATVALVTDYDAGVDGHEPVTMEQVFAVMRPTSRRVPRRYSSTRSLTTMLSSSEFALNSVLCISPTSTTSCRRAHRPDTDRAARRGAAAGRRGSARARSTVTCATCRAARDGDLLVVNDTRVIPARLRLHARPAARPRCCCSSRSTTSGAPGRRWSARPQAASRASAASPATATPLVEIGERTEAGDTFTVDARRRRRPARRARRARRDAAAAVHHAPRSPTRPLPDRLRRRARHRRRPRPPGCTSRPSCSTRSPRAGVEIARVELVVGLDTFRPVAADDPLEHVMHSERYRVPTRRAASSAARARRVVAVGTTTCGRSSRRRRRGELEGRTELFIHRGYEWQVVDVLMTNFHLPRTTLLMMIDAFVGRAGAGLYADGARRATTASCRFGDAMLLDRRADRDAIPVPSLDVTVGDRRRRRRAAGVATHRRRLVHARRASCRSAPAARSSTSAPPTTSALGAEIVLGNTYHLMLRPGRRRRRRARRARPVHRLGRPDAHRLRRLPDVLARARRSTTTASRSGAPTTARPTASRPESAVAIQELLGADIQMVLDVCPPLPSPPEVVRLAVERTAAWADARPRAPHRRDRTRRCSASSRAASTRRCAPRAPQRTVELELRRLRHRRPVGGGDPRARCCRRSAAALGRAARRPAPLPDGRRRPGGLVEAVARGVDQFDCVLPTRLGRHGTALTTRGGSRQAQRVTR